MPWYSRWQNVFRSERLNSELDDEFQHHLAQAVDDLVASGMSETDALRAARRRLGNYGLQKERTRDMNIAAWLDSLRADLAYGFRQLKSNPGFAAVAILSLALGIGANTAIFQLVNAIRLKSLPVKNPHELVRIDYEEGATLPGNWFGDSVVATSAEWDQIRAQQQAFSGMLAWSRTRFNLANGGEPHYVRGLYVSGDFFRLLGVNAVLGHLLTAQDDTKTCNAGAVLSYPYWRREFGGDSAVLGRTVSLEGIPIPVIGVTPESFFGLEVGSQFDIAVPLCADALIASDHKGRAANPTGYWLSVMGRLKPGWTVKSTIAHLHTISHGVMQATVPSTYPPITAKGYIASRLTAFDGSTGLSTLRSQYERSLWILMAITGLVLLIACANLANLLLARATVREPEIAVRLALGASRGRLIRQLLAESLLLAVAGTAAGVTLAMVLSRALIGFISPAGNPVFVDTRPDAEILLYSAGMAVLTCILFGLAPALRSSHLSPADAMRTGGRSVTAGRSHFGLRRILVTTQVALSLVLLFGALLFVRSFRNLLTTDPGFQAEGLLAVNIDFDKANYPVERRAAFNKDLASRFRLLPGTVGVSQVAFTPISGMGWNDMVGVDNAVAENSGNLVDLNVVTPGYFRTMETRLIAGRDFNDRDGLTSPKVAIVNQAFARRLLGGANPIGHTFRYTAAAGETAAAYQIIGLAANTKVRRLREDFKPVAFLDAEQDEKPGTDTTFVIRVSGSPARLMNGIRKEIAAANPSIARGVPAPLRATERISFARESDGYAFGRFRISGGESCRAWSLRRDRLYGGETRERDPASASRSELGPRGRHSLLVLREAVLLLAAGMIAGAVFAWWAGKEAATLLHVPRGCSPAISLPSWARCFCWQRLDCLAGYFPARRAGSRSILPPPFEKHLTASAEVGQLHRFSLAP